MKKTLLLSMLAFGALTAGAQSFAVMVEGNEIENNSTIDCYNISEEAAQFGDFQIDPEVQLVSSEDATFTVSVTNTSAEDAPTSIQFCWPSGCVMVNPGQSQTQTGAVKANIASNLLIDTNPIGASEVPQEKFTISCAIVIVPENDPSNSFSFNLNMIYDPNYDAAVDGIIMEDIAPEYYNLNGVRVNNPDNGIYIVKRGSKVSKVIL